MSIPEVESRSRLLGFLEQNAVGSVVGYSRYGAASYVTDNTTSTSMAYIEDGSSNKHSVTFKAPSTGNVEIAATITADPSTDDTAVFALSDNGSVWATYTPIGALSSTYIAIQRAANGNYVLQTIYWTLPGLTPGISYTFYLGFANGAVGQSINVYWGGTTSDLIMKATVLPATIGTYP